GELVSPKTTQTAYDVASESVVLMKNDGEMLPLNADKLNSIAVIGLNADRSQAKGGFTAGVKPKYEVTPLQGLRDKLDGKVTINYAQGYVQKFKKEGNWRTPAINTPDPELIAEAVDAAKKSDVAIIFGGNTREIETETKDRKSLDLPFGQDELIKAIAAANPKTIVVIIAGGAVNLHLANKVSPSILYGWFNGSEAGNAIADILFGDINPSGKLPFTIPAQLSDVGAHSYDSLSYPGLDGRVVYKEGILVGYRWFEKQNIKPAYPFGHGLSYTNFEYSEPILNQSSFRKDDEINISIKLRNTGEVSGKEVVQTYIGKVNSEVLRPIKELKAFKKVDIDAGSEKIVNMSINANDLAYYNEDKMKWVVETGTYILHIGSSSEAIKGEASFEITN
ncbi:MAG: glycoside hydrolase family 3 C-terminal domain-containing protein, partial [Prolixibacteraceae bacterium]|nr:glycoside hydrolase family 3 C-terminal domain-containing protein [Prolixibacteraceae bacterium]